MEKSIDIVDAFGNRVCGVASIPDSASSVAVLSHGLSSNKNSRLYIELSEEFNRRNIGSVRYEYYGHGPAYGHDSPGYGVSGDITVSKAVESLRAVKRYLKEEGDFRVGLLGSSFGGLISIIVASRDLDIDALALKSAVTEPKRFWTDRITQKFGRGGMELWQKEGKIHYTEGVEDYDLTWEFWEDLQKYDTLAEARKISCPTIIVHGSQDICVPIAQSRELASGLGIYVDPIEGVGHDYSGPEGYAEMKKLLSDFMVKALAYS